jgi:hypothetical protein
MPFFCECGIDKDLRDKATKSVNFQVECFYWLCKHFGVPKKGPPSSKFDRSSKFDSIPSDVSTLSGASSKFRAYLLLGCQGPENPDALNKSLRYFFSVTRDFKATLLHEPFDFQGSGPREIQTTTVDFSDLTQNKFSPPIFFKYHKDCKSLVIASKKWQCELLKDIADVWGTDIHDLDPLALAFLAREGKIRSVFCVGTSTYRP